VDSVLNAAGYLIPEVDEYSLNEDAQKE
jgi:hypothetical protein